MPNDAVIARRWSLSMIARIGNITSFMQRLNVVLCLKLSGAETYITSFSTSILRDVNS
jgi:hypothetical protein